MLILVRARSVCCADISLFCPDGGQGLPLRNGGSLFSCTDIRAHPEGLIVPSCSLF